jgi:hypothetical protein
MRRVLLWGFFVTFLASLTWLLGHVLPIQPRCVIGEDFHNFQSGGLTGDGRHLITSRVVPGDDGDVWDADTGKRLGTLPFRWRTTSPAGRFVAGREKDGSCIIFDLHQFRQYPVGLGNLLGTRWFFLPTVNSCWSPKRERKSEKPHALSLSTLQLARCCKRFL